ncbi:hypothetical protein A3F64_02970 [Candidatus Saccharibacteria bacterium RIFCSPHIGHO2_12_FULL_42_8]|nr:MAG: hypothetical protein A3F64_02970 [Candidatus Saccharibacteria bacterium RIFCSPHIGHO2_12_FULL_42_8]
MATRKKTTAKKTARATVKRSVASKKTAKSNFWKVEFTINTVYWIVIGIAVISAAALSYNTNQQVNDIYDQIDRNSIDI